MALPVIVITLLKAIVKSKIQLFSIAFKNEKRITMERAEKKQRKLIPKRSNED